MHELSIAMDVCRIAEAHVEPAMLPRVTEVGLDVGATAGVEFDCLEFALEALLSTPPFGAAVPNIRRLAGGELRVTYVEVDDDDS